MNNPILWILLAVSTALVIGALFFVKPGAPVGPMPAQLLPETIEGFILVSQEGRIEPVFPGEEHSAHTSYTPVPGGPWSGKVDHLGIAIFRFKDPSKMGEAQKLLVPAGKLEEIVVETQKAGFAAAEAEAGVFWQDGALFVAILATSPAGVPVDSQALREATLVAARAVLARRAR